LKKYIYTEINPKPSDIQLAGLVLLNDNETFSDVAGARVLIFNDPHKSKSLIKKIKDSNDIDYGFLAALKGDAEEISISNLVKFYLANGM